MTELSGPGDTDTGDTEIRDTETQCKQYRGDPQIATFHRQCSDGGK